MAKKVGNINYEEVINRKQKRISELRNDLAYYNGQLRHLRCKASQNGQTSLDGPSASVAETATSPMLQAEVIPADSSRLYHSHMHASPALNSNAVPVCVAKISENLPPHSLGTINTVMFGQQGWSAMEGARKESRKGALRTNGSELRDKGEHTPRYWTEREHNLFLHATEIYGPKSYAAISQVVQTRTPKQVRNHAHKYQLRVEREAKITQNQLDRSATMHDGNVRGRSKNRTEKKLEPYERKGKAGTKRSSKDLLSGPSTENSGNLKEETSKLADLTSFDDFMNMISGTAEGASVKRNKMIQVGDELDLEFLDVFSNTKPDDF